MQLEREMEWVLNLSVSTVRDKEEWPNEWMRNPLVECVDENGPGIPGPPPSSLPPQMQHPPILLSIPAHTSTFSSFGVIIIIFWNHVHM
jgi:hypothetical protein